MNTKDIASEYRLVHWAKIMSERVESGQSIRTFCMKIGIHENVYFYWQKKLREVACEQLAKTQNDSLQTNVNRPRFIEVKLQKTLSQITPVKSTMNGNLSIEISGVKMTTDNTYPVVQLAYLLKELTK